VFATLADFVDVRFHDYVEFSGAEFRGDTRFGHVRFAGSARFATTRAEGDMRFDHSWARLDVPDTVVRTWPTAIRHARPGVFAVVPGDSGEPGDWGQLEYVLDE
jgi:hypothetical protein